MIIQDIVLAPVLETDRTIYLNSFTMLSEDDVEMAHNIILQNKISPTYLDFLHKNDLIDLFSEKQISNFEQQRKRYQIHSLEIIKELNFLDKIFKEKKLSPLYLKGVAIMNDYDDLSLRPLTDIDIFFKGNEFFQAYQILTELNYFELRSEKKVRNKKNIDMLMNYSHAVSAMTRNGIVLVDLHHRITKPKDFRQCPLANDFFENERKVSIFNNNISVPSIENTVLHQLVHFSVNSRFRNLLRTFFDIKQIEKNHNIKWETILRPDQNLKLLKALSVSLEVLNYRKQITSADSKNYKLPEISPDKELIEATFERIFSFKNIRINQKIVHKLFSSKSIKELFSNIYSIFFVSKSEIMYFYKLSELTNFQSLYFYTKYILSKIYRNTLNVLKILYLHILKSNEAQQIDQIEKWFSDK